MDLSKDNLAKYEKIDDEGWYYCNTPYFDSNGEQITIWFIHEPNDERIGEWFTITDSGRLNELGLSEFIEQNYSGNLLNEHSDYAYRVNKENLGNAIIEMARFISGLSRKVNKYAQK